jgi:hypothetical protein
MTRKEAETGPSNCDGGGPADEPELDRLARLNAQLLPPGPGMLEADRHSYPLPPQRVHGGRGISTPTGGRGGGFLHENRPTKAD